MDDGRPRIACAGGINQDAHGHPARDGAAQRGGELFSGRVVVEDVGGERDGFFGRFDGGEHGGKRLIAVDERLNVVAGGERERGDAVHHVREHFQMFRAGVFRFAEVVGHGPGESAMHAERDGAAADAIDAKHEVKYRSKSRHQPDDPDPKRCGAGITFVQQGMG